MSLLQVPINENDLILNTPNRKQLLKAGPTAGAKCNVLGRGAFGTVFKATFKAQQVAVKVIKLTSAQNLQSMRREAHVLGWKHHNIVGILKIETTVNYGIVIMQRYTGTCLQNILDDIELPLKHRLFMTLDIVLALSYCHARGLLHLDVKPQNMLVSLNKNSAGRSSIYQRKYVCKLFDFGSSMIWQQHNGNEQCADDSSAGGTLRYMAPEILRKEKLTPAADIYSLGISMWQMQQRRLPFYWLECNDAVAYQVVKHNLRPDDRKSTAKTLLPAVKKASNVFLQATAENHSLHSSVHNKQVCSAPIKRLIRSPMRQLNTRTPYNQKNLNVVRSLHKELGIIADSTSGQLLENNSNTDFIEIASIFAENENPCKALESTYVELYRCCWHSNASLRTTLTELRNALERILSK